MFTHSPNHSTTSLSDVDDDDMDVNKSVFFPGADFVSPAKWSSKFRYLPARVGPRRDSPMSHLPPEILIHILKHLNSPRDLYSSLLVSRAWCECSVELLWHKPTFSKLFTLVKMMRVLSRSDQTFTYAHFIRRLNFLFLGPDITDTLFIRLAQCDRLERLTLVGCTAISENALSIVLPFCPNLVAIDLTGVIHTSDKVIEALAESAKRLQGINLGGCKNITDKGILALANHCPLLRRVKLSGVEPVTDEPISALAKGCPLLLEIDLNNCIKITDISVRDIWTYSTHMRELRLAHCVLTDAAFPAPLTQDKPTTPPGQNPFPSSASKPSDQLPPLVLSRSFEHLRMLDLTACSLLTDDAIEGVICHAPKIRNLVLSKCTQLTDRTVENICRLGRHIHYLHLGHAASITDRSVRTLARCCTRIRYIDFANCSHLTDMSVFELSSLPKLRRIGLVRVSNLTDEAIYSLADRHATLERIHLSYCDRISVMAIHFLLQKLHKLTHLSLTGIPAFRKPELQKFCRPPPSDFNMMQRAAFCVYSGKGVLNLRAFLTELVDQMTEEMNTANDTEYDDEYEDNYPDDVPDVDVETADEENEYPSRRPYIPPAANGRTYRENRASTSAADFDQTAVQWPIELPATTNLDGIVGPIVPRRARGFGQLPVVEMSASPPPSDAASIRSTGTSQSNGGGFFRTHQEITSSHSNGALTPDLNFAEIGHGRGTGHATQVGSSAPAQRSSRLVVEPTQLDAVAGPSSEGTFEENRGPELQSGHHNGFDSGFNHTLPDSRHAVFSRPPVVEREEDPHPPISADETEPRDSVLPAENGGELDGRGVKRGLRNPFTFAANSLSFGRTSNGHEHASGGGSIGNGAEPGDWRH